MGGGEFYRQKSQSSNAWGVARGGGEVTNRCINITSLLSFFGKVFSLLGTGTNCRRTEHLTKTFTSFPINLRGLRKFCVLKEEGGLELTDT